MDCGYHIVFFLSLDREEFSFQCGIISITYRIVLFFFRQKKSLINQNLDDVEKITNVRNASRFYSSNVFIFQ